MDIKLLENFTSEKKNKKIFGKASERIIYDDPIHGSDLYESVHVMPDYFDFLRDGQSMFYDSLPLAYVALNEKGVVKIANQAAVKMLSVEKRHLINTNFIDYIYKEDKKKIKIDKESLFGTVFKPFDIRLKKKQSLVWVRVNFMMDEEFCSCGSPLGLMITDINDLKHVELEKSKLQHQLLQAQKMEVIGNLSSGIVHDFNNILHPIIGNLELLIDDTANDRKRLETLENVLNGAKRACSLVKQILSFTHTSSLEASPVKIQPIIREILKLSRSSMSTGIKVIQSIDNECGKILADPIHVYQIVMNLITNACHAMGKDGGILDVTLKEIEVARNFSGKLILNPGIYACLSVADTGYGIDSAIKDKIFDPCFTTKKNGTGLGLSVISSIVKKYGGGIDFSSEPGKGSLFKVYIPLCQIHSFF
ncbi:two-component system sensor histidine kinase NtrB [Desulfobacula phenolica]|uniref:histidine kinase n=1 Tax=Desulfobacula phenolica TaxID=90732 RepID=A0A1H2HTW7_9BACT|nr:ATP-binding protein [Desulfobacula phenolica]SDU34958.1 His Kinase A (phospho-acceptor) domain-containing protein [Desulfobacula phenolica]